MALWPVEMTDGVVAGREIPQNQLETVLVLYPDSSASPRDFPLSDAVEISRLRFTALEMTGGVVPVGMAESVVPVGMAESVVSREMTDGIVSVEMTGGVVPVGMAESVVPVGMAESVMSREMTDGIVSVEMTGGVVAGRNDWWRCGRSGNTAKSTGNGTGTVSR